MATGGNSPKGVADYPTMGITPPQDTLPSGVLETGAHDGGVLVSPTESLTQTPQVLRQEFQSNAVTSTANQKV